MDHVYSFPLEIDTCDAIPSFGEFVGRVNDAMASFGFPEKIVYRNNIGHTNVTANRPLTNLEIAEIKAKLQEVLDEKSPKLKMYVGKPTHETRTGEVT